MKLLYCKLCKRFIIKNRSFVKYFSSDISLNKKKENSALKKYSNTLLLPKTTFPLRSKANHEEEIQKLSSFSDLYSRQQNRNTKDKFIVHDGPPYANGDLHLGHAVNKISKDIICRYRLRRGTKVEFIPGWDCHGLPIELKAVGSNETVTDPLLIRRRAFKFANEAVEKQMKTFKRWGIMADWSNPYFTYDKNYVSHQIEAFGKLWEKGLVYKAFRPVYWSPSNKTVLAEAELEYNPCHEGYSVFVKFKVNNMPKEVFSGKVSAIIWTTTPWTLISNQAIAYNKHKEYAIVRCSRTQEQFLVAEETIDKLSEELNSKLEIVIRLDKQLFKYLKYESMTDASKELPFIDSDTVLMTKGSGLVHCAPNHGYEDYCSAVKHGISLLECVVDEDGKFKEEAGPELRGKYVLNEGSELILDVFSEHILSKSKYVHSYPYDWRSKQPVIALPTTQWFLDISAIREKCIEVLESVEFNPNGAKEQLINQIMTRPPWCLSRQRSWGVPIPAFYNIADKNRKLPFMSKEFVSHVSNLINTQGIDIWWTLSNSELIPNHIREKLEISSEDEMVRDNAIFDVWFDSGMSWKNVLNNSTTADVYLEGNDQIRGWFQSSLILSVALRDQSPFKNVCIHGFVVDENNRKMSKSEGNVVDPKNVVNGKSAAGADGLRWWVARNFSSGPMSFNLKIDHKEPVDKVRSTIRFCIASLNDFGAQNLVDVSGLYSLDKYMLHTLHNYCKNVEKSYNEFDLKNVAQQSMSIVNHISSFYFAAVKDRLYCDAEDSERRRSAQTVLFHIYNHLLQNIAPILPHLCEELFQHQAQRYAATVESVFEQPWIDCPDEWFKPEVHKNVSMISEIFDSLNKTFISQQTANFALFILCKNPEFTKTLQTFQNSTFSIDSELTQMLRVSSVAYGHEYALKSECIQEIDVDFSDDVTKAKIYVMNSDYSVCHRCRRYTVENNDNLCLRCLYVMASQYSA